jgi:transposase
VGGRAARLQEKPIAQIAKDLQISKSCLRRWMDQADIDEGHKEGLTRDERAELVRLRRENRVQAMEMRSSSGPSPTSSTPPPTGSTGTTSAACTDPTE